MYCDQGKQDFDTRPERKEPYSLHAYDHVHCRILLINIEENVNVNKFTFFPTLSHVMTRYFVSDAIRNTHTPLRFLGFVIHVFEYNVQVGSINDQPVPNFVDS